MQWSINALVELLAVGTRYLTAPHVRIATNSVIGVQRNERGNNFYNSQGGLLAKYFMIGRVGYKSEWKTGQWNPIENWQILSMSNSRYSTLPGKPQQPTPVREQRCAVPRTQDHSPRTQDLSQRTQGTYGTRTPHDESEYEYCKG
eukprot:scaffold215263_cov17-Prasinocladus_malaysianus.AAC.1